MKSMLAAVLGAATLQVAVAADTPTPAALGGISEAGLLAHIKVLASDEFEGRSPGSPGEAKTIAYLVQQMRQLGLKPGNPDGSYVQAVPLRGMTPTPQFSYRIKDKTVQLRNLDDFVLRSSGPDSIASARGSELVFVGYGTVAPEYGWDDYKGMDVRGKTLLMLINDPAIPDPANPARLDPAMFRGDAMTYYGRWTYKYEIAAKLGAAGAIIIHETKPAAYPYDVVRNSFSGENFSVARSGPDPDAPPFPGWLQLDRARELFTAAGQDFDALKRAALSRDFRPVVLPGTADFSVSNTVRSLVSHNAVGLIEGSDPELKKEFVIYSAHWDHFGIDTRLPGAKAQQVYHGALDNASGVAALLQLAKAYQALPVAPKRSILFLFTTAEERGLLGAKYYASHPLYPLARTLANINIDGINAWGPTAQIEHVTSGHSTLDDVLAHHAQAQGRAVVPDSLPQNGSFYRADQLEFARAGVPVIYTKSRSNYIGKPDGYAHEVVEHYYSKDYHKVSDDVRGDWDFRGGVQDIQLLFQAGYDVAQGSVWPQWKPGSEFHRP
jgi:Zn-dependent M28 family amino/carboxypeptidase